MTQWGFIYDVELGDVRWTEAKERPTYCQDCHPDLQGPRRHEAHMGVRFSETDCMAEVWLRGEKVTHCVEVDPPYRAWIIEDELGWCAKCNNYGCLIAGHQFLYLKEPAQGYSVRMALAPRDANP